MAICLPIVACLCSCKDTKTYAELLNDEQDSVNKYLANYRIVNEIPADTIFEVGPNAPFYKVEPEGNVYMQVLDPGNRKEGTYNVSDMVYFRYMRANIHDWVAALSQEERDALWDGNMDYVSYAAAYFLYNDFSVAQSSSCGYGIQIPVQLLGQECEVNIVVKSQYGLTDYISYVYPMVWHVRYYKSMI